MKIRTFFTICAASLIAVSTFSCGKGDWAVKIDDDVITIDEFYKYYYAQNKIMLNKSKDEIDKLLADPALKDVIKEHPTLNKTNFMDFLVSRKLLMNKAYDDKSLNEKDLETVEELFTLQGVGTYYLIEKLKDSITVEDSEIDQFYRANRNQLKSAPMNDQLTEYMKQQVFMHKFEQKSSEMVMDLIAEAKVVRDGFQKYIAAQSTPNKDSKKEKIDLDETAVEIDDEKITIGQFLDYYYTQNKILSNMTKEEIDKMAADPAAAEHPTLSKQKFMDFLISRKLLYKKAMDDKKIDENELETVTELFRLQGIPTYYLMQKLKNDITITDQEIEKFYVENKKHFKGVPINEQVTMTIKQQLFMKKFEQKSSEFVMNLIAEAKVNREGFKNHLQALEDAAKKDAKKKDDTAGKDKAAK